MSSQVAFRACPPRLQHRFEAAWGGTGEMLDGKMTSLTATLMAHCKADIAISDHTGESSAKKIMRNTKTHDMRIKSVFFFKHNLKPKTHCGSEWW